MEFTVMHKNEPVAYVKISENKKGCRKITEICHIATAAIQLTAAAISRATVSASSLEKHPQASILRSTCICRCLASWGFLVGAYREGALGTPASSVLSYWVISPGSFPK